MLAALDALIQNGTGGRRALALRQLCELFLKLGASGEESTTTLFDEIMANIAADLDDETVVYLSSEMKQMAAILPAFASTVSSKGHEITLRPKLGEVAGINSPADEPSVPVEIMVPDASLHAPVVGTVAIADAEAQPVPTATVVLQSPAVPTHHQTEPRHGPAVGGLADPLVAPQTVAVPQPARVERRMQPREPAADANNPITLARKASVAELLQIAILPNLPETLTNVLVARGERDVLEKVLQNKTATFSRSSLTTLSELAPSDRMIRECLIARRDLPEPIIERLLPFLAPIAKAQLLYSDSPFSEDDVQKELNQASADLVSAYRNGQMLLGIDTCLASVDDGKMTVGEVVMLLARDIRIAELSAFIAARLGILHVTAFNALSSRLDHATAVLVRALGCDMRALEAVMVMRGRCGCREARETKTAGYTASKYTTDEAVAVVARFDHIARSGVETNTLAASINQENTTPEALLFAA